jgi:hypothetical protein
MRRQLIYRSLFGDGATLPDDISFQKSAKADTENVIRWSRQYLR